MALRIVRGMCRWKGSPNSYALVCSRRSPKRPSSGKAWLPRLWAAQTCVDFAERLLADHARTAGGELPLVAVGADVAGLCQGVEQLLEVVERVRRVVAEQLLEQFLVDAF